MRKIISLMIIMSLISATSLITRAEEITNKNAIIFQQKEEQVVAQGIHYEYKQVFTLEGWVDVHVLMVDLTRDDLSLELLRSTSKYGLRHTMTDMVAQYEEVNSGIVVGGINGSFFNMARNVSEPIGVAFDENYLFAKEYYNVSDNGAASLVQTESGNCFTDYLSVNISLKNDSGRALYIAGVNRFPNSLDPVIYNQEYAADSSGIDKVVGVYKIVVINDTVTELVGPNETCSIPLLSDGYIVTIPASIAASHLGAFQPGTGVTFNVNTGLDIENMTLAISGGGKIIDSGNKVNGGLVVDPANRHPRSAIGLTEEGKTLVAMVVDGRGESIGATHSELGDYLLDYGVYNAIHFDGGGSSTLLSRKLGYIDATVANQPSGGDEREVLNGLAFVSQTETGPIDQIDIICDTTSIFKNNTLKMELVGYDENYNPVNIDSRKVTWSVTGDITGTWGMNTFTPTSAGEGTIRCYYEGAYGSVRIRSLDTPIDLTVEPQLLRVEPGETARFTIHGLDNSGFEGAIDPGDVVYTVDNIRIGSFIKGEFISTGETGLSKVRLQVGERWTTAYVVVGEDKEIIENFTSPDVTFGVSAPTVKGTGAKDYSIYADFNASYKMDYEFIESSSPQKIYLDFADLIIEDETDYLSIQVYGNNNGHEMNLLLSDSNGKNHILNLTAEIDFNGWKELRTALPGSIRYPVRVERLEVVSDKSFGRFQGQLNIDQLAVISDMDEESLKYDDEGFIDDELHLELPDPMAERVSLFGMTGYKNRLLDNIVMEKVYSVMNNAALAVFCGYSDVKEEKISGEVLTWKDTYDEYSAGPVKFIFLGTSEDGLRATQHEQYQYIDDMLKTANESTIVFIGNKNPLTDFSDEREGDLFHSMLKNHQEKTGKTIMYINASGYDTGLKIIDHIRYFDLNGLWYHIDDRYVDLDESFYTLDFYISDDSVKYMINPLYPLVELVSE